MNGLNTLVIVMVIFACLIIPVPSQSDEESILKVIQNTSVIVVPTGTALSGSKESIYEYQNWLDDCAFQIMRYLNIVMRVFGLNELDWYHTRSVSDKVTVSPTIPVPVTLRQAPAIRESPKLTTIASVTGQSGKQSANVTVPSGYWELWYTVDPLVTGGQDSHSSSGSNSAVFPTLSMVITDANDPNNEIETVEPPGGLDVTLWKRSGDPRPWSKKFYRGYKKFNFDITARHVKSYVIEVRVPKN